MVPLLLSLAGCSKLPAPGTNRSIASRVKGSVSEAASDVFTLREVEVRSSWWPHKVHCDILAPVAWRCRGMHYTISEAAIKYKWLILY